MEINHHMDKKYNFLYKFFDKKFPGIDKADYGGFIDFEDKDANVLLRYTKGVYNRLSFNLEFIDDVQQRFNLEDYDIRIAILKWLQDEKKLEFPGGFRGEIFMV